MKEVVIEDLVDYEKAKLARDNGFDELCTHYWFMDFGGVTRLEKFDCRNSEWIPRDGIAAPTKSVFKNHLWIKNGRFYGYPDCCIEYFCESHPKEEYHEFSNGKQNCSGFVPCPEHKKQIIEGKTTLSELISKRFCKEEFKENWVRIKKVKI